MITVDRSRYGATEINGLIDMDAELAKLDNDRGPVQLHDRQLARIVRLRLLTDPSWPYFDVSYCWGELYDGTRVRVHLPVYQLRKRCLNRDLVDMARAVGVYAKGLGLLDPGIQSFVY